MKQKTIFPILTMSLFLTVLAGQSPALEPVDSMRCGSKLVQVGDTKIDIISRCGEPALREKITRTTSVKKSKSTSSTSVKKSKSKRGSTVEDRSRVDDQWTYNFGPQDFLYTLTFEGVEVKSIGRGGRGTRR
jgi:hypothetical protein